MKRIAFIGLGAMGRPMARNLLKRGFPVRGFDLDPRALAELRDAGGSAAASAAEACADADVVVLMVVDARQAEAVLFSEGALAATPPEAVVCLMATCPPRAVEAIAARVTPAGRRFVDAPVSGGTAGATAGTLTVMAAAPGAVFEAVRPVLAALGDRIFHVGERPGQAAMVKTVNQLLCGVHIAAAAEALALAWKVGVDARTLLEILSGTSAASWMLRDRGPRMVQDDPAVSSAVDIFVKDLGIVLEAGRETGAALPLAALSHQLFLSTSGRGDGRADDSQVIRAYRALNGG
ncbi:NAD(P)-dependent oxidoreductase [Inquilinus sp. OTU3971]|uniref:NAD(P)-dependent oxidoreductase n=1 Tax=Inquilinus sp. OTU3971 TaxID=3043855 RepID=UPI00313A99A4